ncbi:hypothetical protein NPA31_007355 [Aurantimonas sp. MSK8Z-1]|uniref:hypothetical protein n=1 Tax=Mangrovibrevibacter kandeliae TaxID=2968473 RepID=UPI0021182069|nr:hypothetical protein [Aurantimonas sp. MSK8Z-1]MCW4114779.1 hypothetical protein [Aurantimonas sp. MSK8Z-1]
MTSAWLQTLTGRALDFGAPAVERAHLAAEIAPALAKLARYAGHTDCPYSVAQHSVLMAEAALDETGDAGLAALCLLHDAHDAYLGDWTSPVQHALADEMARQAMDAGASPIQAEARAESLFAARRALTRRLDRAILAAAGISPERAFARKAEVDRYDLRMLHTERLHLMRPPPRPWDYQATHPDLAPIRPRKGRIKAWGWIEAEERFAAALATLCPETRELACHG